MNLPNWLRRVNRVFTNRVLGMVAWILPPMAVVYHQGRKSGKPYKTPIVAFLRWDGVVMPLTYGRDVDWAQNLLAAGGGEIMQMGRKRRFKNPRIVDDATVRIPFPIGFLLHRAKLPGYVVADYQ